MLKSNLFLFKWEHLVMCRGELREIDYGSEREDIEDKKKMCPSLSR